MSTTVSASIGGVRAAIDRPPASAGSSSVSRCSVGGPAPCSTAGRNATTAVASGFVAVQVRSTTDPRGTGTVRLAAARRLPPPR